MKYLTIVALLLVFVVMIASQPGWAAQRTLLLETFTNVSCIPCAVANPVTQQVTEEYGPQLVLNLQYHTNWPAANDPFYLDNPTDNMGRITYYTPDAPDLFTDGADLPVPGNYNALVAAVEERLEVPSPFTITVSTTVVSNQITVEAEVTAVDVVPTSGLVLQIALVEPYVDTGTPPGANGESEFYSTMRDMLPSSAGTPFTINNGQSLNFSEMGTLDPSWQDVYAVVWVQDNNTKEVLQAKSSLLVPDYDFYYRYPGSPAAVVPMNQLYAFHSLIDNIGSRPDSFNVHIEKDIPSLFWGASVCANGICYPPWTTDFTLAEMAPGAQDTIDIEIQPLLELGTGTVTITVSSFGDPSLSTTVSYMVISHGVRVLLVDGDGGETYETYYQNALNTTGRIYATWDMETFGKVDTADLDNFQAVVWNVGSVSPAVDEIDRNALSQYLDGGGRLFITGQNIGYDLVDPDSGYSSPQTEAWFRDYLGADYVADDSSDLTVFGQGGDPIGDGLSFDISGGSGANNQTSPSEIEPYGGGIASLFYAANLEAGVHLDSGTFKSVYFAFGFEGIAAEADRDLIMQRVMDWFEVATGVSGGQPNQPYLVGMPEAHPNPFNPATHIKFEIAGNRAANVQVAIYDLRGHLIRNLWNGSVQPGLQDLLWNGRSDTGFAVASGVYVARINVDGQPQTLKMTLAK